MRLNTSKSFLSITLLLIGLTAGAQDYAPKDHYLIDSLDLNAISQRDKAILDSLLTQYQDCNTDTCRILKISQIVEQSWDENVWPKYNIWVHDYVKGLIPREQDSLILNQLKKSYAGALNNIGYWHNSKGEIDPALEFYKQCLEIQQEINDKPGMSGTFINMGYIFLNQGLIEQALSYYYSSLKIEEEIQNQSGIATALNGIGYIQYKQGDIDKALLSYSKSLKIRQELNDQYGIATCLNNLGLVYKDQQNWEKALNYYQQCLTIEEELSDKSGTAISLGNIGYIYDKLGKLDKALSYYNSSLEIRESIKDKVGISQSLNSIADILSSKGELSGARKYALRSLKFANELEYPVYIRDAAQTLSSISKKEKKWEEALKYFEVYIQMRDSVFNEETVSSSIHQQYKYSYEKKTLADSIKNADEQKIKEAELAKIEAEKKQLSALASKQKQESYFLVFVVFSALLFAGLVYSRMKAISRHQRIIEEQHEELKLKSKNIEEQKKDLEDLNQDLTEFAHIVSHDLKNPLHTISGMMYLVEEGHPDLEESLKEKLKFIKEGSAEANKLIDGILEYSEAGRKAMELKKVDINTLLNSIIDQIHNETEVNISVKSELPIITCNEFQFRQILSNLISNAVKYNDKKDRGEVVIDCTSNNDFYEFTVSDNGPGIPEHLQSGVFEIFQKAHSNSTIDSSGIGLSIVKKLVIQNGGTVSLESEEGKGSAFKFTWPKQTIALKNA